MNRLAHTQNPDQFACKNWSWAQLYYTVLAIFPLILLTVVTVQMLSVRTEARSFHASATIDKRCLGHSVFGSVHPCVCASQISWEHHISKTS